MDQTNGDLNRDAARKVLVKHMYIELLNEIEHLLQSEEFSATLNELANLALQKEKSFRQGRPIASKLDEFLPLNIRAGVWTADEDLLFEQVMGALVEYAKRMPSFVRQALSDRRRRPGICGTPIRRRAEFTLRRSYDDNQGWG